VDKAGIEDIRIAAKKHFDLFDHSTARSLYEQICSIDPRDTQARLMLGLIAAETGHDDDAIVHLETALRLDPELSTALQRLGEIAIRQGRLMDARNLFGRLAHIAPDNQANLHTLAGLLLDTGDFTGAIRICESLLRLDPANAQVHSTAGSANQASGNLVEALKHLAQAARLEPDNAVYTYKYGCILQTLGDLDAALACFRKAAKTDSVMAVAIGGMVRVHAQRGNYEEIKGLVESLLEACTRDPLVLPTLAHIAPVLGLTDTAIHMLEDSINRQDLTHPIRSRLHHALGKLYDLTNSHEAAFRNYRKSKELVAGTYDARACTALVDRIISVFSHEFMRNAPHATNSSRLPVFIVGMPRSGTSLVEQILASHKDIYGAGELPHIARLVGKLSVDSETRARYPEWCYGMSSELLDAAASSYLGELGKLSADASRITDKMPHNFLHLGLIELLFPDARIIHVSRSPMDTCLSCYFQEFSTGHAYTKNLADLAHHYRDYVRLMEHWNEVLGIRILNLAYEDLVTHQEPVIRKLVGFCELEWDDSCLAFYMNPRVVSTLSADQVRKPLHRDSIGRWKYYREYLAVLEEELGDLAFPDR